MDMPITNEFKKDTTLIPIPSLKIVFFLQLMNPYNIQTRYSIMF